VPQGAPFAVRNPCQEHWSGTAYRYTGDKTRKKQKTKDTIMSQEDMLTAIATAAEMLRGKGTKQEVAADLERLVLAIQAGETR
jgi:hypothetical protein